jgi:hypothetical protein
MEIFYGLIPCFTNEGFRVYRAAHEEVSWSILLDIIIILHVNVFFYFQELSLFDLKWS